MKEEIYRAEVEAIMGAFSSVCPELIWDRFTNDEDNAVFYGWIPRKDGQRDFLLLTFSWDCIVGSLQECLAGLWWTTSSAKYSERFALRCIGHTEDHTACQKIAGKFNTPLSINGTFTSVIKTAMKAADKKIKR